MKRKSFANMQCPIARSLEQVGEWWSILLLRDSFHGLRRFDEFQRSLQIAPNILARRLATLVRAGLFERQLYSEHPPRYEYVPTGRARDFQPMLWMLLAWGNKHFAPEGPSVEIVDRKTGSRADPVLVDRLSGKPLNEDAFGLVPGPAAGEAMRRHYSRSNAAARPTASNELRESSRKAAQVRRGARSGRRRHRALGGGR
jgi:DNA-binding HxlR family transcriptional regulator